MLLQVNGIEVHMMRAPRMQDENLVIQLWLDNRDLTAQEAVRLFVNPLKHRYGQVKMVEHKDRFEIRITKGLEMPIVYLLQASGLCVIQSG